MIVTDYKFWPFHFRFRPVAALAGFFKLISDELRAKNLEYPPFLSFFFIPLSTAYCKGLYDRRQKVESPLGFSQLKNGSIAYSRWPTLSYKSYLGKQAINSAPFAFIIG